MVQLNIRTYPDSCLRIKTREVKEFNTELESILRQMTDLMYLSEGIGLAATQVGLGLSLFVADIGEGLMYFVNPTVIKASWEKSRLEEGCLSLPGIVVDVKRPVGLRVKAQNEKGIFFVKDIDGLMAKAVQHEMDHLKGRLIIDYLDPVRRFFAVRNLIFSKNRKKTCEVVCNAGG